MVQQDTKQKNFKVEGESEIEKLVNRSRLLGQDPNLVLFGGGNTSSKILEKNHMGVEKMVLRIKGSGSDLKTIKEDGFSGLYLDELLTSKELDSMSDEDMVEFLAKCMVNANERRPSIETLLHAFIDAPHVDHVHSDAICTLTNHEEAEKTIKEALGEDVAFVSYYRPGFHLSKLVQEYSDSYAVVLEHHGLVTWGDTHEESYLKTLELEDKAKEYIKRNKQESGSDQKEKVSNKDLISLLLTLRGELSKKQKQILSVDDSQLNLANRKDVEKVATAGRSTLEHILRIGKDSLVATNAESCIQEVENFRDRYNSFFEAHKERLPKGYGIHENIDPKVGLIPGAGCFGAGITLSNAKRNIEIAKHTHEAAANVLDLFTEPKNLTDEQAFDIDYWPLELYKLTLAAPVPSLAGYIFLFAGDSTNEVELLEKLLKQGAHILLLSNKSTASDLLNKYASQLIQKADTLSIEESIDHLVLNYGGIDGVFLGGERVVEQADITALNHAFELQQLTGFVVKDDSRELVLNHGEKLDSTSVISVSSGNKDWTSFQSILGN